MSKDFQFIIKEEKYSLLIIKKNKPTNKRKAQGISIFRKTLELNELNEDNINMILKKPDKKYIYSLTNLGLALISDVILFIYVTPNDIDEVGVINLVKIYKIKNINYIILDPDIKDKEKSKLQKLFKNFVKAEVNKGLYFSENVFNLGNSYDIFYHHLYDYNPNIYHINQKFNFIYNYDYIAYFRNFFLDDFTTSIINGFYYQKIIKKKEDNDLIMHLFIRNKHFNKKEEKDLGNGNNNNEKDYIKYSLHEIEIILSSNDFNQLFHFIFYNYFANIFLYENKNIIKNILKENITKDKKDNGALVVIDVIKEIGEKKDEEKINFLNELKEKMNKEIGDNNKYIFIKNKEEIVTEIKNNQDVLKEIKFNYEFQGSKIDYQEKQILLISSNGINSLAMIENILINLDYKFWNDEKVIIPDDLKNIYLFAKEASMAYKNFLLLKNKNFQKLKEVESFPLDEDYLKKYIISKNSKFLEQQKNEINIYNDENNNQINKEKNNNKLYIYIVTYNVNNLNIEMKENLDTLFKDLLFPKEAENIFSENGYPTFYCIGLQEIVKLNASNIVLFSGKDTANFWETKISQFLQTNYNYTLQYKENLVGVLFLFFIKTSEAKNINKTKNSIQKSGFLNYFGNKGSLFYEFNYKDKNFAFCTGHLTAGSNIKNYNERETQLINILNHQNNKDFNKFYKSNFYFIFGDLNFRVRINKKSFFIKVDEIINNSFINEKKGELEYFNQVNEEIDEEEKERAKTIMTQKKDDKYFLDDDELSEDDDDKKDKEENKINTKKRKINEELFKLNFFNIFIMNDELNKLKSSLSQYELNEEKINFLPTYKYYKGTNCYNVTNRVSSWTDRILYKKNKEIKCLAYDKIYIKYSDHKPIFGIFEVEIKDNNK